MRRTIFYVSDGTGITAETIGHSVLTQFDGVDFETFRIPFVDDDDKARTAALRIKTAVRAKRRAADRRQHDHGPEAQRRRRRKRRVHARRVRAVHRAAGSASSDAKRSPRVGKAHGLTDFGEYEARINATNYALTHDDGIDVNYGDADLILVGVSRVGKTPTCLYMALHYGVKAANYPLTEEDLEKLELPKRLRAVPPAPVWADDRGAAPDAGARGAPARQQVRRGAGDPVSSRPSGNSRFATMHFDERFRRIPGLFENFSGQHFAAEVENPIPNTTWAVTLLPDLERQDFYDANASGVMAGTYLEVYLCPSDGDKARSGPVTSYVANGGRVASAAEQKIANGQFMNRIYQPDIATVEGHWVDGREYTSYTPKM